MSDLSEDHPSGSPLPELARLITAGAVRLAAATAAWLRLIAEFDERGGWQGVGIQSCGHWLAWQCGLSPGAAREHVRVARALRGLPLIESAFANGRLSYSKVRALTRIAAPDCEAALLDFALCATASQTERFCRQWRRVDDSEADREPRDAGRSFECWTDDAGVLTVRVRMPADEGAALMAAIDSLAERAARRERAQAKRAAAGQAAIRAAGGTVDADLAERCAEDDAVGLARERTAARRVAALTSLAEARVTLDRRPGDPPRREVVVHVDAGVLAGDEDAGRAHVEGGPALSGAQARRLLCGATVVTMLEQGREPLAVGRRRRRATRAQRQALLRRDGGCARPGCPEARIERLHAHHLRHWLFGGGTDLANLVLLCDVDHGLVHDHDLVMARRGGRLVVTGPDGRRVWGTADAAFDGGLAGLTRGAATDGHGDVFAGVHPVDTVVGRRPDDTAADGPAFPTPAAGSDGHVRTTTPARVLRRRQAARPQAVAPVDRPGPVDRRRNRPRVDRRYNRTRVDRRGTLGGRMRVDRDGPPSAHARARHRPTDTRPGTTTGTAPGRTPVRMTSSAGHRAATPATLDARMDAALFPNGAPDLRDTIQDHHDRMDMAWALSVLMGHRDLVRRLAAEAGGQMTT